MGRRPKGFLLVRGARFLEAAVSDSSARRTAAGGGLGRQRDLLAVGGLALATLCLALTGVWRWSSGGSGASGDAVMALGIASLALLALCAGVLVAGRTVQECADRGASAAIEEYGRYDELSGTYSYRHLRAYLRETVEAARSDDTTCALVLLDLDDFKEVNERCGHLAGDRILSAIGDAMREVVAGGGVVARFGGDEFAVVLPGADRSSATAIAAAIRDAVSDASVRATPLNRHLAIGASFGVAQFPDDGDDDEALIARADNALYDAKARAAAISERRDERHAQDVFFAIGEAMGRTLDAKETVRNIVSAVGEALGLDACAIRLADDDDILRVQSYYLADAQAERVYGPVESNEPLTREEAVRTSLLTTTATYIDDVTTSDRILPRYRRLMAAGTWMVTVPLSAPHDGFITLMGRHAETAPPPTGVANAVGRLASASLRNSDVYEAARRQGAQLSRLAGVTGGLTGAGEFEDQLGAVAAAAGEALNVDALTIDTLDPEGKKPFCRNVYSRRTPGRTEEEMQRIIDRWRMNRPALNDPDTVEFLRSVTQPIVIDDAQHSPLITDDVHEIVVNAGVQSAAIVPINWQGELKGMFYVASARPHAFGEQDVVLMQTLAAQLAPALQIASLHVELQHSYDELKEAHLEAILRLAYAAEARDPYTGRHLHRIKAFASALGEELGLEGDELEALGYGAVVHDLGKLRIPDAVLIKAGELSDDEWKVMKQHPEFVAEFLGSSSFYDVARQVAMHHHERWDGTGYPHGLRGELIPLAARIVSVADVYDALTSDRPYKVAWPPERALAELLQMRGKTLCPYSVDAFLRLWNDGTIAEIERESGYATFEFDFRERYAA